VYLKQEWIKVIDGKRYPATKDDLPKKHSESGCTECKPVLDASSLATYMISREDKNGTTHKPRCVGLFTMPGWVGHSRFYIFRCKECQDSVIDYPHGYTSDAMRDGLLFLRCNICGEILPLYDREVYEAEGLPAPLTSLGVVRRVWYSIKRLGDKAVQE